MANSPADILAELEETVATCPPERCARILSGVVHLLAAHRDRPQDLLVNVVDGVLMRLMARVDAGALVQLSKALAELRVAPTQTLQYLAAHESVGVARPILLKSRALSAADLQAVANSCSEQHRLAIAARDSIEAPVTETLLKSGERTVILALIKNPGAAFSDAAYATLIGTAAQDDKITEALAVRPGTPDTVVRRLLSVAAAPIAPKRPGPADYAAARPEIVALNRIGKLNDSTVNRFAVRGETANLFTALSVLSGAPTELIEHVVTDEDCEGLVMACRASRLNWQTTLSILSNRSGVRLSFAERERAQQMFDALLLSTSQWTVRWGEIAASATTSDRGRVRQGLGSNR